MAFVSYDTETTGIDTMFDQVLQFAAILTDDNLVEVDRFEIRSRLLPHVIASPGAMNVTGVTAQQLEDASYPSHYEMVCQIHEKLRSWQPAQFVGHNSIMFDEALLRSAFYKCLLPIYLTNTHGNSRLDSLKMLQSASLYEGDEIIYPLNAKGAPSFKLDQLAPANGFNHANAHEAMSDVEATIFMCRKLRDGAPDTWSRYMRFSQKGAVFDFCESEPVIGLTEFYFGRPYTYLLHQIGIHPIDSNAILAVDLNLDPDMLADCSDSELSKYMTSSPKAVRKIKANALPGIIDADKAHMYSKMSDMDFDLVEARANRIANDQQLKDRLLNAYLNSLPDYGTSPYVEENIYSGGFPSNGDEQRMVEFHEVAWSDRYNIVCQIQDDRFRELGEWLIYCEAPHCLNQERQHYWQRFTNDRLLGQGEPCKVLTLSKAIQQADNLLKSAEEPKRTLLIEHRERLVNQFQSLQ